MDSWYHRAFSAYRYSAMAEKSVSREKILYCWCCRCCTVFRFCAAV